jgi:hypothetical protein
MSDNNIDKKDISNEEMLKQTEKAFEEMIKKLEEVYTNIKNISKINE